MKFFLPSDAAGRILRHGNADPRASTPNSTSRRTRFSRRTASLALTYDDVTLATLYSEILPRDTQLDTRARRRPAPEHPDHLVRHGHRDRIAHGHRHGAQRRPGPHPLQHAGAPAALRSQPRQIPRPRPDPGADQGRARPVHRRRAEDDRGAQVRFQHLPGRGRKGQARRPAVRPRRQAALRQTQGRRGHDAARPGPHHQPRRNSAKTPSRAPTSFSPSIPASTSCSWWTTRTICAACSP